MNMPSTLMCVGMCAWLCAGSLLAHAESPATPMGTMELRITDHAAGIEDFERLSVQLAALSVHARGAARNAGWLVLTAESPPVDIVPLKNGRFVTIGTIAVPSGSYDAVRVKFGELTGALKADGTAKLTARDSTVATAVDLAEGDGIAVVVDLYAESQTDHAAGRYEVKINDVRTQATEAADLATASMPLAAGEIVEVHADARKVTVSHDTIEHLNMPPMVMIFGVADEAMLSAVKPGDKVLFGIGDRAGMMVIDRLVPVH